MRVLWLLAASAVVTLQLMDAQPAQQEFTLAAIVTGADGQPVSDLGPSDFSAAIDGRAAEVRDARFVGPSVTAVLMLDRSGSMAGITFSEPTAAPLRVDRGDPVAEDFDDVVVPVLRPDDRVRFGEIASKSAITVGRLIEHSADAFRTATAGLRIPDRTGSPLWDGVVAAVSVIREEPGHRLVVLVTDGMVSGSLHGLQQAAEIAVAAHATVSVVSEHGTPPVIPQVGGVAGVSFDPARNLRWLATATAGVHLPDALAQGRPFKEQSMAKLVAQAISENRGAYRVTIRALLDRRATTLTLSVTRPGVTLRAPGVLPAPQAPPRGTARFPPASRPEIRTPVPEVPSRPIR